VEPDISKVSVPYMLRRLVRRDFHRLAKNQLQIIKTVKKSKSRRGASDALNSGNPSKGRGVPRLTMGADHLLGVAQSLTRELAYVYSGTLSPVAAGGYTENLVRLNDAYTAQPDGFGKYVAFYSKCFVVGTRLRVCLTVLDNNTYPVVVGVTTSTNTSSLSSSPLAITNGMSQWNQLFLNPNSVNFRSSMDVANFLHKPRVLDDPQLFCTASAAPTQGVFAHIWAQNNAPTGTQALVFTYELIQKCIFTDPIPFS
jgi:hypothetical protein